VARAPQRRRWGLVAMSLAMYGAVVAAERWMLPWYRRG
jgi:hypothetical protein